MRFSRNLLMGALVPAASAQLFTNTSTTAEPSSTAIPGTGSQADLSQARLGPGASFTTYAGQAAILLAAPAFGTASFVVPVNLPDGITAGDLIQATAGIDVSFADDEGNSRKRSNLRSKRAETGCTLIITVDGVVAYDEGLSTTDGTLQQLVSEAVEAGETAPELEVTQDCSTVANPPNLIVASLGVQADDGNGGVVPPVDPTATNTDDDSTATETGTETGTATETGTETGTATGTDDDVTGTETGTATGTDDDVTGTETGTATGDITATATDVIPTGAVDGFPLQIEDFVLFGCVGSSEGYPTFELVDTSDDQDLNRCAESCAGRNFFGVHENDCYCGDEVVPPGTSRVELASCDIECPGDDQQFCGGNVLLDRRSRLAARQGGISTSIFLTVFVQIDIAVGDDTTVTATVTDVTTLTTTFVETVTGPSTTETATVTAIYKCFSGHCYPTGHDGRVIYVFQGYPGEDCYDEVVYLPEPCSCKGGVTYVPHKCTVDTCKGITVYKPEVTKQFNEHDVVYTQEGCDGYTCVGSDKVYKPVYEPAEKPVIVKTVEYPASPIATAKPVNPVKPSDNQGGNNQGGENQAGNNQGGEHQAGNNQGGEHQAGNNQGGESKPDTEVPVHVSGTAKQAVSVIALVAAIAAAAF